MNFDRYDLSRIQISLLVAVAVAAASAVVAWVADRNHEASIRAQATARAQLTEYEGKLRQVAAEETEIKQKSVLFSNLRARGILGEEQRLDWVELIKEIRDARKLLDLQYEFAPQQPLDKAAIGNYTFRTSPMRLQMKLLHEGDLLNFINDLRSKAKAYVRVRSCNVARIPRHAAQATETALLTAECELEWITILPAKGAP